MRFEERFVLVLGVVLEKRSVDAEPDVLGRKERMSLQSSSSV